MARTSYGYGCWNAPYWFLGPEQGMAPNENNDLSRRVEAWRHFGSRELDDCREFHLRIGETSWHGEDAILQSTWKKLLLTLMAFLERPTTEASRLNYQRNEWGRQPSDTCVIEISGLAAHNLNIDRDRECFREERIKDIRERLQDYKPKFVIMYGKSRNYQKAWKEISKGAIAIAGKRRSFAKFLRFGPTLLVLPPHPVSWGTKNEDWTNLGIRIRHLVDTPLR